MLIEITANISFLLYFRLLYSRPIAVELASYLFHDLRLRSYLYYCVWSVITAHNLTPEKRDVTIIIRTPSNRHYVPPKQHSTYNWHLSLLWVSVMYT